MNHNMCGSDKLQIKLREEGGIRALLGMVRSRHPDVLAQVARGIANFAKCESRGAAQGRFPMITLVSYACAESIEEGMHL
jgi:kinesin family protein 5